MPRFIDGIQDVDKAKLMRLVIYGLILLVVGLSVATVASAIADSTTQWTNIQNYENSMNFWNNLYGINEYNQRASEITQTGYWMNFQSYIFGAIGNVAIYFGFLMAIVGLFGFAMNKTADDKSRLVCMITACALLFAFIFSVL